MPAPRPCTKTRRCGGIWTRSVGCTARSASPARRPRRRPRHRPRPHPKRATSMAGGAAAARPTPRWSSPSHSPRRWCWCHGSLRSRSRSSPHPRCPRRCPPFAGASGAVCSTPPSEAKAAACCRRAGPPPRTARTPPADGPSKGAGALDCNGSRTRSPSAGARRFRGLDARPTVRPGRLGSAPSGSSAAPRGTAAFCGARTLCCCSTWSRAVRPPVAAASARRPRPPLTPRRRLRCGTTQAASGPSGSFDGGTRSSP
mmetsp:Transcript_10376/g.27327  ORF Transcript_10376/g.27327 Transcript_10376/m.27327 type:complete len:257 (-) Transcript_10376:1120-1890(-)